MPFETISPDFIALIMETSDPFLTEVVIVTGRCESANIEIESLFSWDGNKYIKGLATLKKVLNKRSNGQEL